MIRQLRLFRWFIIGFGIAFNSVIAFAATQCAVEVKYVAFVGGVNYYGSTKGEVCEKLPNGPWTVGDTCWKYDTPYTGSWRYVNVNQSAICPDGTSPVNGMCNCDPCKSLSGQAVDDGSIDFGDGANKKLSMNFAARPDDNYVGQGFCSGGCAAAVDKEVGSSGITMGGRYYGTFSAKHTGSSCTATQPPVTPKTDPGLAPKNSPEYNCISQGMAYGYVNDAVKCVPKSSSKEKETKTSETNKPDGSKVVENKSDNTFCSGGVCNTTTTTTTTEYNSSGTSTGTTTKTESTTKPDPSYRPGTGGSGNGEGQGAECGIAGKPPCAVKVDETDVKTDVSALNDDANNKFNAAYDQISQKLEEVTRPKDWGLTWNYTVPEGACSAIKFGGTRFNTTLDICKPLGYVRDLWAYVMYVLTGLYIWRAARDAMNVI